MTRIIENFREISGRYDAALVDLWGCVHNGFDPFAEALGALVDFRQSGGKVILLTTSPRPRPAVVRQLEKIGVPSDVYDDIASSGDASQFGLAVGDVGYKIYHLGPERDLGFYRDLPGDVLGEHKIELVPLPEAEGIVCTGLFDDATETPDDYKAQLIYAKSKNMRFLCTNPDIFVDSGAHRIFCAGALAKAYEDMGGESLYFGKPHPPIYDLARRRLTDLGNFEDDRIIAIGDGINTDIRGAIAEDIDCLFITGGLAAAETGTGTRPDKQKLRAFIDAARLSPTYAMGQLR